MSNNNAFPPREIVDQIQRKYPAGTVVVLDHMEDSQAPKEGTCGVVTAVDDIGTIHVNWLTGGGLGVCYGEDSCHIASPRETALYRIGMEAKKQHDGSRCPRCGAPMPGGLYSHALSRRAEIIVCDRCGQEEALEDAASAGLFKAGKPPVKIEDWYICRHGEAD